MFHLDDVFLFKGLKNQEKEKIIFSLSPVVNFKKDEIIYTADSFSKAIGILLSGKAFAVTNNGHRVFMNTFDEGTSFGAAAVFGDNNTYASTVIAKTDVTVLFITENELTKIFAEYPVTSLNYIKFLSEKIRFLNSKLSLLSCSNAEDTLLEYLISVKDSCNIAKIPKSMTMLSKMLGIGRATLYRSLDALENNGNIKRENNFIKVIKNEKNS